MLARIIEPEHMGGGVVYAFRITPPMSPKSRVMALAWTNDSDVVVIDSFTFTVEDDCASAAYQVPKDVPKGNLFSLRNRDWIAGIQWLT